MSHGKNETEKLKTNMQDQLARLLTQLQDLEDMKGDLSDEEYETMKAENIQQLQEFKKSLQKLVAGNLTLISELDSVQLAIQAAVSKAFRTPEVIRLFAKKEPGQLRTRLANLERDAKLQRVPQAMYVQQAVEILTALKKLGEELTTAEQAFLAENMSADMREFEKYESALGEKAADKLTTQAGSQVKQITTPTNTQPTVKQSAAKPVAAKPTETQPAAKQPRQLPVPKK